MSRDGWDLDAAIAVQARNVGSRRTGPLLVKPSVKAATLEARSKPEAVTVSFEVSPCQLWVRIPMRLESRANLDPHHMVRSRRVAEQRSIVRNALVGRRHHVTLPCTVWMTRIAPHELDTGGNLEMSLKAVRDEIADWLGLPNDRDRRVVWECLQRREAPRSYGVELRFVGGVA